MSEVLKGWVVGRSFGDEYHANVAMEGADLRKLTLGQEILLVPDDGSHKVVTVEEWERLHGFAWRVVAGVLQDQDFDDDETFTQDVRALAALVKDTGPRAILATEGGDK